MESEMNNESNEKIYEIWEVPEKLGRYQKAQYFYVCMSAALLAMANINYIFAAADVNYRCRVPECDGLQTKYDVKWWPNTTDRCSKPILNESVLGHCTDFRFTSFVEDCTDWVYENHNSIVSELNLACEPLKISMIGTIHNIGMMISTIVAGWMADRYGRKPSLIFFTLGLCVGNIKILAASYYSYVIMECIEAIFSGGLFAITAVLIIEIGDMKNRVLSGVLLSCSIYAGECIFTGIAKAVPYWKHLILIIYTPSLLAISLIFLLKESPRWQCVNQHPEKAIETLQLAAKVNKLKVKKRDLAEVEAKLKENFAVGNEKKESLKSIFGSKEILIRLIVVSTIRFTTSFMYYGLMINSVLLPGDKYINIFLCSLASFPGELICWYLMEKVGRKLPLIIGFILCCGFCAGSGFVQESYVWLKICLFLLGKMLVAGCYTGALTYSLEIFPTSVRGTLLGMCAFASELGGMLAPLTPMLHEISMAVPVLLFAGFAAVSGVLLTLLPETKDLPLMDTVGQVEASIKKNKQIAVSTETVFTTI